MPSINSCLFGACNFDKIPTPQIILFELVIFSATFLSFYFLSTRTKHYLKKYSLIFLGVFIFELFTAPVWNNYKLGVWAYAYRDISWVLTLGWSTLITSVIVIVDKIFHEKKEWQKFLTYLLVLTPLSLLAESLVVTIGIRSYAPEITQAVSGYKLGNIPLEAGYYIPVFLSLVICFYKYWIFILEQRAFVPVKKIKWLRKLSITILGVLLFELMVDPLVQNANLPSWSYLYRDISILILGIWVLIIWLSTLIIDRLCINLSQRNKFALYMVVGGYIGALVEAVLVLYGFRVYGPSAVENFVGYRVNLLNVPIEVVFAIPFYLALMITFLKYWELVQDNNL